MFLRGLALLLLLLLEVGNADEQKGQKEGSCMYGHPGIPGDPGHNGLPGRDGRDGVKGDKGERGDLGLRGAAGLDGPRGDKGELGPPGTAGAKGRRGENGERGSPGKMGPQGVQGPVGVKGQKGELGLPGPQGIKGEVGPEGPPGEKGALGYQGEKGFMGPVGSPGRPGPKGEIGPAGHKGSIGYRGERGPRGEKGDTGDAGPMPDIPKSAFSAGLTESTKLPASNAPIRFDRIIYNKQSHYDPQSGRFTCAFSGAYYFTYHITVFSRNVKVALMKNGQRIIHTMDNYQSSEDQAAGGTVLHLEAGDKVWLQVIGGAHFNGLYADEDDDTIFSGFLIFPDGE
ncbi:hypothetical protein AALO_G00216390 [Alosa alosa]|uniref:C1q domain-containing protein n=1 Tax=Alosa alosa TaxID=278164 RepID=A0AAV6G7Z2_9TELE|nr:complement C1q and tumor necrosis factor-related protein 9A isoform X1 [Alosa sapidissima]XP_048122348.1 complement C1q and tumor necrosis factor-related protein 9A isoform X1 [Alosa alosa]KAG5268781.1 hypothetical protein AALO_G00216390 [Alosa alosa]